MDPAMMRQAMEMMKNIPPDQMRQMMSSMTPEMMQQAQAMASRMSPEDMRRAQEQMAGMKGEDFAKVAAQAQTQMSAQQSYVLRASKTVKDEGNQLHSAGRYAEAVEKYERAKNNVEGFAGAEAAELRKACTLNLSSCYLNMKDWEKCITQCNEVLAGEADSLKALYRRGQAYMGQGRWQEAVEDLTQAVRLSSHDPSQQRLIKEKLQDAKDQVSMQRAAAARSGGATDAASGSDQESTEAAAAPSSSKQEDRKAEQPAGGAAHASTSTSSSSQALPSMPGVSPDMMQAATDMMKNNPDWYKQVDSMLAGMSDEQLQTLSRSMGHEVTRDQIAAGRTNMEHMAKMQAAIPPSVQSALQANPRDPAAMAEAAKVLKDNPEMLKMAADMFDKLSPDQLKEMAKQAGMPADMMTPEMAKQAAQMMSSMSPQELARMSEMAARMNPPTGFASSVAGTSTSVPSAPAVASSSSAATAVSSPAPASTGTEGGSSSSSNPMAAAMAAGGGMPPGLAGMMSPEMMKAASEMMDKMSPEDIQRMTSMMGGAGRGGAGGAGGMPSADMLGSMDPGMLESSIKMMRGLDDGALASMLMSSGMVKSPAQADQMVKQLKGMSDTQLNMMVKATATIQKGAQAVKKAKDVVLSRAFLILAVLVLLLAFLLRYFGIM